jgi:hypothetical protein
VVGALVEPSDQEECISVKTRIITIAGTALAVALPVAGAQAGSGRDRATGGGQTAVGLQGAGNTIAFTAQNSGSGDAATGQVQYIQRIDGQDKLHGTVSCLRVSGNTAKIAGTGRDGRAFQLYVVDNGQGASADNDMIMFQLADSATCDFDPGSDVPELARGNAQVYDAPATTTAKRKRKARRAHTR